MALASSTRIGDFSGLGAGSPLGWPRQMGRGPDSGQGCQPASFYGWPEDHLGEGGLDTTLVCPLCRLKDLFCRSSHLQYFKRLIQIPQLPEVSCIRVPLVPFSPEPALPFPQGLEPKATSAFPHGLSSLLFLLARIPPTS